MAEIQQSTERSDQRSGDCSNIQASSLDQSSQWCKPGRQRSPQQQTLSEMQEQLKALKEEADRATEAKMSTHSKKAKDPDQNNKVDDKDSKPRVKWQAHHSKDKLKT